MNDDIFAEMEADAVEATQLPGDKELSGIAKLAAKQLELEQAVERTEEHLKTLKQDLQNIQTRELPDALAALGLSMIALENGARVEVKPFVSASIPTKFKEQAHAWLRENGHGDLIKCITSVDTGRDTKAMENAIKALVKVGLTPETKENVHSSTLKAFVREQVEAGVPLPLELFGAFMGQKATITKG